MCTQNAHLSTSGCINLQCTALNQSNAWFFFFLRKWMHIHYIQDNVISFNVVDLPTLLLHHHYRCKQTTPKRHSWATNPSVKFRKYQHMWCIHSIEHWLVYKKTTLFRCNQNKVFFCVCKKLVPVTILGIQSKLIGAFLQCS